ncbi:50S ribosomal protein L5 [Candidatus Woesearchaeota archaeon]|nr:50S ribosomal protein L5 [Candidatus Woesearchaeota archaeon]
MTDMRAIRIEKVTLNIGAGKDENLLKKGERLLKNITGIDPVRTITQKRIQGWSLRPGLPIGVKITLRGKEAEALIPRILSAKDNALSSSCFDEHGNISFGIPEYVDIQGAKYDPDIGIIGLQASITLDRPGYRVKKRKRQKRKIGKHHLVNKQDAIAFMKEQFKITVGGEAA